MLSKFINSRILRGRVNGDSPELSRGTVQYTGQWRGTCHAKSVRRLQWAVSRASMLKPSLLQLHSEFLQVREIATPDPSAVCDLH